MKEKLRIVKIGGNVINDRKQLHSFLKDFSDMESLKILVHGGGKRATELAASLGLKTKMIGGRRVTDEANLEIVTMVYAGLLNKNIVAMLQANNCNAIGLTGADANTIMAHKRVVKDIDYGYAGDVDSVENESIKLFLNNGIVPVFSAITHDKKGQLLNTNADTIASELAKGLSGNFEVELIYCFEKKGVLMDVDDNDSVIADIDKKKYEQLKADQIIAEGMLPKLENCFESLENGVKKVIIGRPELIKNNGMQHTSLTL
jgi:acetylglutamate kinase